ncbi:(2Fe-2S) ferredoxin domain-containing protein [Prochlorococcus sp. MIT 1223]|uniref:(2Fe-2S) ferredoxin domain-containing protein n=1 Tax=Prochlorococcus sp. MIT 1223 TaxID=3096217 RepID=UPI002A759223|nr:(2Fe-2S) ferredoxin domain-containing protein [Prochlorococcus sp. MIT 1223]
MKNQIVSHHLLLCATPRKSSCCDKSTGASSWKRLKSILKELNLENSKRPEGIVLRSKVDCLRVCKNGPILLIWPDGIWYGRVSPKRIEAIIYKHILEGTPINDWIINKTPIKQSNT